MGYLADLFNDVERGAPWPEQFTNARVAFLATDPNDELNPLAYRVLLMLAALYRLWSKSRLRHLQPWIAEWCLDEMYACVGGKGLRMERSLAETHGVWGAKSCEVSRIRAATGRHTKSSSWRRWSAWACRWMRK